MDQKVALISGSTRGIGKAIALSLAKNNFAVALSGRNKDLLQKVVDEFTASGYNAAGFSGDVGSYEDAQFITKSAIEKFGHIDVLINNAGITRDNLILRMNEEEWDAVMQVNLKGAFNCVKGVVRSMVKNRSGVIINISSVVGQTGNAGQANYAAAKAGLFGFTKSLAKELAARNIRVNAIAPGFIQTDMTNNLNDEQVNKLKEQIPLGRLGVSDDVAGLVDYLVSDAASYITGQTFNVDGGMVMI